jgi:uncharacterized membrane protein (UPF0127 family)
MEANTSNQTSKKPVSYGEIFLKFINIAGPIAGMSLAIVSIALCFYSRQPQKLPISATFTKNNQTIQLEVAKQESQLYYGLKFRDSIPENGGMLFVVDHAEPIMHDCIVNDIVSNAMPCNTKFCPAYGGKLPTNQIIEIPAGKASQLGIKLGDKINIDYLETPSQLKKL